MRDLYCLSISAEKLLLENKKVITTMKLDLIDKAAFMFERTDDNPLGLVLEDAFKGLEIISIDNKKCPDLRVGDIIKSINGKKNMQPAQIKLHPDENFLQHVKI